MRPVALALLLATACGGRDRSPTPDWDAAPADAAAVPADAAPADTALAAADFAALFCGVVASCCSDQTRCRAAVAARAPYRAVAAQECLATLRATSTPCTSFAAAAQPCQRVFAAVLASKRLGEPCQAHDECLLSPQGAVRCAGEMGMGRCQVALRGKEGDTPCVATVGGPLTVPGGDHMGNGIKGYHCHVADGLWCDDSGNQCARTKGAGAACTSFGECGAGQFCDDAAGKCTPRRTDGVACTVDEECPSTICGEDNRCAPPAVLDGALAGWCGLRP